MELTLKNSESLKSKMTQFQEMGKAFVGFYYPAFAENRTATSQLANVYT